MTGGSAYARGVITPDELEAARARTQPHVRRTPVERCRSLDDRARAALFLKCEQLQRGGAFKFRGACNAVLGLDAETARRGVATHSSGNHAQALALAARMRGIPATLVMPSNAPRAKRAAVEALGATIVTCGPTLAEREAALAAVVADTGAEIVHPYDDARVIAGQATAVMELLEDAPDLDVVLAPVGGGGLLSGTCLGAAHVGARVEVVGAEPALADDAAESLRTGRRVGQRPPVSVADGLRTALGALPFEILRAHQVAIHVVSEEAIVDAMRFVWERAKLVIEPSAAVPVAAAMSGAYAGRRVGVILSGGNLDLDRLPWQGAERA